MYMGPELDPNRAADLLTAQYPKVLGYQPAKCNSYSYTCFSTIYLAENHDDIIKWKFFPRYWPFVRGFPGHRWILPSICAWINGWVNNREAGDLQRYRAHYDVTVMMISKTFALNQRQNGR